MADIGGCCLSQSLRFAALRGGIFFGESEMKFLQGIIDGLSLGMRETRGRYHLCLGDLIKTLADAPADLPVYLYVDGMSCTPGTWWSYRGYYCDLALDRAHGDKRVRDFLRQCDGALGDHFEGYKGGFFYMDEDTPLWVSEYGSAEGIAIMRCEITDDCVKLITEKIE